MQNIFIFGCILKTDRLIAPSTKPIINWKQRHVFRSRCVRGRAEIFMVLFHLFTASALKFQIAISLLSFISYLNQSLLDSGEMGVEVLERFICKPTFKLRRRMARKNWFLHFLLLMNGFVSSNVVIGMIYLSCLLGEW